MKRQNQKEVWDAIAVPWKEYRFTPVKEIAEFLKNQKGKILDLACGSGRNFLNKENTEIYAVDFSKNMLKYAKKYADENKIKAKFFRAQTSDLPFQNNFFEAAIFIASLHCIEKKESREKSLKELYRVLKPNSKAMISVWSRAQKRVKNKPKESYIPWTLKEKKYFRYNYLYEEKELKELLEKVGFKISKKLIEKTPEGQYSKKNILLTVQKPNV